MVHHPIITVAQPEVITPPCAVGSPSRAAGSPPINTVADPFTIAFGGPGQAHRSPMRAAGSPAINTVGQPRGNIIPPTCGFGLLIGQVCISLILAAKLIVG